MQRPTIELAPRHDNLPPAARELLRRAGSWQRHQQRTQAAAWAAWDAVKASWSDPVPGPTPETAKAWSDVSPAIKADVVMLLLAEVVGRGGPMGLGGRGRGTARLGWACRLGKGRALANDGWAWTAAVADAIALVAGGTPTLRPIRPGAYRRGPNMSSGWAPVPGYEGAPGTFVLEQPVQVTGTGWSGVCDLADCGLSPAAWAPLAGRMLLTTGAGRDSMSRKELLGDRVGGSIAYAPTGEGEDGLDAMQGWGEIYGWSVDPGRLDR